MHIDVASNQMRFRFGEIEMLSKLVEGKFPDYQRVIPTGYGKIGHALARRACRFALSRASILTSEKFKRRALHARRPRRCSIQTTNAEQEEAIEEIDVDYDRRGAGVGFNVSYLQDVLGNLHGDRSAPSSAIRTPAR